MDQVRRIEMATLTMVLSKTRIETKAVRAASALVMEQVTAATDRKTEQVTDLETVQEQATVMEQVLKETVAAEAENKY
jgi:uncharacterized protein YbaP (TraB family)